MAGITLPGKLTAVKVKQAKSRACTYILPGGHGLYLEIRPIYKYMNQGMEMFCHHRFQLLSRLFFRAVLGLFASIIFVQNKGFFNSWIFSD